MKVLSFSLIITAFIININSCFSQVKGKCIDTLGKPLPFINVGVKMTSLGTVTDENGVFYLKGDLFNDIDSLVITHIGYKSQTICSNRKDTIIVVLKPSSYQLKEVNINPNEKIYKNEKIIGTKASTDHVVMSFMTRNLGTEIGKIINVKKDRTYKVEKVFFNISQFDFKKATFRINFYNVTGKDSISRVRLNYNDLTKEVFNIGLIEVNVEDENFIFTNDFFVSIEWIDYIENSVTNPEIVNKICFNSTVFSGPFYSRSNNLIKWKNNKFKYNTGLGIHLLVKY